MTKRGRRWARRVSAVIVLGGIITGMWWLPERAAQMEDGESRKILERSLRSAVVNCYAQEGFYPPNLAYIEENYGVRIDESRFRVYYEAQGSNLMPDITIIERR